MDWIDLPASPPNVDPPTVSQADHLQRQTSDAARRRAITPAVPQNDVLRECTSLADDLSIWHVPHRAIACRVRLDIPWLTASLNASVDSAPSLGDAFD